MIRPPSLQAAPEKAPFPYEPLSGGFGVSAHRSSAHSNEPYSEKNKKQEKHGKIQNGERQVRFPFLFSVCHQTVRAENAEIRQKNEQLSSQVTAVSAQNENLSKRMTLAEKLNVSALSLTPLKSNGKQEKRVGKAKQLRVSFTIPQNNSTPVGEKTLFVRITNPEGTLLGGNGTFDFEGGKVAYTERKTIEYDGQEIAGISIYWNVNSVLNPGQYTVEIFADNYRLISRKFTFEK